MAIEEKVMDPNSLIVTFVHNQAPDIRNTMRYLDSERQSGKNPEPVIAINFDERLYVYDGNKRVRHAKENGYNLNVRVINDKDDFWELLRTGKSCWFGVEDFELLKKLMRMYGEYPNEGPDGNMNMPKEYWEVIAPLIEAREVSLENQRKINFQKYLDLFPPDEIDD